MGGASGRQHPFCNFITKVGNFLQKGASSAVFRHIRIRGFKTVTEEVINRDNIASHVRSAVFWRSGSQIIAQMVTWGSTLLVIRILSPGDYGLFAMTSVILTASYLLNGFGFASALI